MGEKDKNDKNLKKHSCFAKDLWEQTKMTKKHCISTYGALGLNLSALRLNP